MKRYRLKLSLPEEATTVRILGKRVNLARVFPNAFVIVANADTDIIEKLEVADLILAQFGIGLVVEEA